MAGINDIWTSVHTRTRTDIPYRYVRGSPYNGPVSSSHADDIARRVKRVVSEKSKSARAASLRAGLSEDFVSKMARRGSVPELSSLLRLAEALEVPVSTFFQDDYEPPSVEIQAFEARPAAGDGALITEEQGETVPFSRKWLRGVTTASPDKLIMVQVWGDSMEPTIPENAWVMIDTTQTKIIDRQIYVFRHGDDARVKRLITHPTMKQLTIRSDNPDWDDITVEDPENLQIIGRVIWYSKKVA